jgi:signal peptidase I
MENFNNDGEISAEDDLQKNEQTKAADHISAVENIDVNGMEDKVVIRSSSDEVVTQQGTGDKGRIDKQIKEYALSIVVAIIIALTLRNYVFARADVEGNSMVSTLHDKDVIFVEKISLITHSIKRGQIIIFDSQNSNGDIYVKRVIGIEGDEIEIKNGNVYLNGNILTEEYLDQGTETSPGSFMNDRDKYKVPKDHVFVLGDNRNNSLDSRTLGPVNIKNIKGHTIFRIYPFKQMRIF